LSILRVAARKFFDRLFVTFKIGSFPSACLLFSRILHFLPASWSCAPCTAARLRVSPLKRTGALGILIVALCLLPSFSNAADVTIAWDPNMDPDLEGYAVYYLKDYSSGPTTYTFLDTVPVDELADPDNPMITLTDLEDGQYYFVLTAYDTEGNESDFSDELCVSVSGDSISQCYSVSGYVGTAGAAAVGGGSSGGGGSSACFIASVVPDPAKTEPFQIWRKIRGMELAIMFLIPFLFFLVRTIINWILDFEYRFSQF